MLAHVARYTLTLPFTRQFTQLQEQSHYGGQGGHHNLAKTPKHPPNMITIAVGS
jgi:hypothetical protein